MRDDALQVLSRSIQRSEPYSARDLAYGLGLSVVDCQKKGRGLGRRHRWEWQRVISKAGDF